MSDQSVNTAAQQGSDGFIILPVHQANAILDVLEKAQDEFSESQEEVHLEDEEQSLRDKFDAAAQAQQDIRQRLSDARSASDLPDEVYQAIDLLGESAPSYDRAYALLQSIPSPRPQEVTEAIRLLDQCSEPYDRACTVLRGITSSRGGESQTAATAGDTEWDFEVRCPHCGDSTLLRSSPESRAKQAYQERCESCEEIYWVDSLCERSTTDAPEWATATFHPQQWMGDLAVEADPEGPTEWLVPRDEAASAEPDTYDSDALREYPNAPLWVKEWSGPFYIEADFD